MKTIEYRTMNEEKATWGPGEWISEPDKVQWQDEATRLPCLAVRNRGGNWCGYVGVTEAHPWFGKSYNKVIGDCNEDCDANTETHWSHHLGTMIEVHGGLTFSDMCTPGADESTGICHVPDAGEPDHVWWFGFDCGHCQDFSPAYMARDSWLQLPPIRGWPVIYRTLPYVQEQCCDLARQLAARNSTGNGPERQ